MEKQASLHSLLSCLTLSRLPNQRVAPNLLVSSFLCLATVAALVTHLEARDDSLATFTYEVIPGIFIQDDPTTVPSQAGPIPPSFGLIDSSPFRWTWLKVKVFGYNLLSGPKVQYKLLFFGRHGEGWHNVAKAFYGKPAWYDYWSKVNGNGTIAWGPDAQMTPLGREQAKSAAAVWKKELPTGAPVPQVLYSSPLSRAADTAKITFDWWFPQRGKGRILEGLREVMGVHTCDKRQTKSYIQDTYGNNFDIIPLFTEQDELWQADARETDEEIDARTKATLDCIFRGKGIYLSVTAHGGAIRSIFRTIGHREYSIPTGGVVPVLLKGTRV